MGKEISTETNCPSKKDYSYFVDFLIFIGILIFARYHLLQRFYASFFISDGSEAFMQVTYYLEALRSGSSPFWDKYINLQTQGAPYSPIFSPVTILLIVTALLFKVSNIEHLAYMFAFISYALQVLAGFSMYLFLRYISLGRLAAIVGGMGYTYNLVVGSAGIYGINMGYYRMSALMIVPIILICIIKLFSQTKNTLYYIALSGFLLGVAFVCNGDVKPTMSFVPVFLFMAYFEGYKTHGFLKTTYIFTAILIIAVSIASVQFYTTYEALQEGVKSTWNQYRPTTPLHPDNTLLGFAQNTFSIITGFLFPHSFFEFYRDNTILGITADNYSEQKFGFGISLFILSVVGVFYKTRRHIVWFFIFVFYLLYVLGANTTFWPIFGFLSEIAHLRYPTRTGGVVLYFLFSIYAAYGIDVIMKRSASEFYDGCYKPFIRYLLILLGIISLGLVFVALQYYSPIFSPLKHTDQLSLIVSKVFVYLLILTLAAVIFKTHRGDIINETPLSTNRHKVETGTNRRLRGWFLRKAKRLGAGILNYATGIVNISYFFKILSFILISLFITIFFLFYLSGFLSNYSSYRDSYLFINLYGIKLHKESLLVISGLVLGLVTIMVGYRIKGNSKLMLIPLFAGMAALFLNPGWSDIELPSSLITEPSAIFKKDVEFEPMYRDKDLSYYRIQIPHRMRNKLAPGLGFQKSVYNYCCRQYMDKLRFSFGFDAGPIAYENILNATRDKYDHPFWKLYNVKYIVDDFKDNPLLLPQDSNSYERISDYIIKLKDTKPLVYFMEDFEVMDRHKFLGQVVSKGDTSILERVYLHDTPEGLCPSMSKGSSSIKVTDMRSGRLRAYVSTDKAGILVFSEVSAPSWRVYVDGVETKVLRAYGMFQAVQIEPGYHEVLFKYEILKSWKMRAAIVASLIALIFVITVVVNRCFRLPLSTIKDKIFSKINMQHVLLIFLGGGLIAGGVVLGYSIRDKGGIISSKPLSGCREITIGIMGYMPGVQKRIILSEDRITVSSFNNQNQNKNNLIDNNMGSFWHIKYPKNEPDAFEFVNFDLGDRKEIKVLKVMPRPGNDIVQMWDGDGAYWEGSNDRHVWQIITRLQVNRSELKDGEWINFILPEYQAFRYYRLKITDPDFLSFAEIELYG